MAVAHDLNDNNSNDTASTFSTRMHTAPMPNNLTYRKKSRHEISSYNSKEMSKEKKSMADSRTTNDVRRVLITHTGTHLLGESNSRDFYENVRSVSNDSLNFCDDHYFRDSATYTCDTISNVTSTNSKGLTPSAKRSKHGQVLRQEFRIYEKDSGLINDDDDDDNTSSAVPKKNKCSPKSDEPTAQRFERVRSEATRIFVSSALGASLARAFLRFRSHTGQFAMNVRQAMRRSLVVKGFMHPNAVAVRTIHVHIGLVVFICVFELVIGAITVYRFIHKRKRRRLGHIAAGLVLLVGRQLLTICFALIGGAVGQIILFGAPVAGAILGAVIGAAIGQVVGWLLSRILKKFLPRLIRHCARQLGWLPDNNEERYMILADDSSTYTRHRPYECCPLSDFNSHKNSNKR